MRNKSHTVGVFIIVVQLIVIAFLQNDNRQLRHQAGLRLSDVANHDPILLALIYETPIDRFAEIVKDNPGWINYRHQFPVIEQQESAPPLARFATLGRTNHVDVLIAAGADIDSAIEWHQQYGTDNGVRLLQERSSLIGVQE